MEGKFGKQAAGVKTPWQNGDRKNTPWTNASLGMKGWEETNRKNGVSGGFDSYVPPLSKKANRDGTDESQ